MVDITGRGKFVLRSEQPTVSSSNANPNVIRDGIRPDIRTGQDSQQYSSYSRKDPKPDYDTVGFAFDTTWTFCTLDFQEGIHRVNGGWFDSLWIEILDRGEIVLSTRFDSTPRYSGRSGRNFDSYRVNLTLTSGDAIRLVGTPGGDRNTRFISIAELRVYALKKTKQEN
ncbi:MAG: hypothetical protein KF749_09460 [Bacteroidetes bacterium]|nr:hypothetical protein [Bacteroidota bacterium]MCW5894852.1 hypothetical protein [Bacteroidota bacterium]